MASVDSKQLLQTSYDIIIEEMRAFSQSVIDRSEALGQKASGKTYESFETRINGNIVELWAAGYIGVLQTGRKPGKVPYDFEKILTEWARNKGITFASEKEMNNFVRALKWRIIREGTRLFSWARKPDIFDTPLEDFTENVATRISDYYTTFINENIF